jgi:hypothetical protein
LMLERSASRYTEVFFFRANTDGSLHDGSLHPNMHVWNPVWRRRRIRPCHRVTGKQPASIQLTLDVFFNARVPPSYANPDSVDEVGA